MSESFYIDSVVILIMRTVLQLVGLERYSFSSVVNTFNALTFVVL